MYILLLAKTLPQGAVSQDWEHRWISSGTSRRICTFCIAGGHSWNLNGSPLWMQNTVAVRMLMDTNSVHFAYHFDEHFLEPHLHAGTNLAPGFGSTIPYCVARNNSNSEARCQDRYCE